MKLKQAEKIVKLLSDIDIDVNAEELTDFDTIDGVEDFLHDNQYFNVEIIYHSKAMEYLTENDTSLRESLELAHDMGYTAKDLNSEILASILASQNVRNDFYELRSEIEEILE